MLEDDSERLEGFCWGVKALQFPGKTEHVTPNHCEQVHNGKKCSGGVARISHSPASHHWAAY